MRRDRLFFPLLLTVFATCPMVSTAAFALEFFSDDFEAYLDDMSLVDDGGWQIVEVTERGQQHQRHEQGEDHNLNDDADGSDTHNGTCCCSIRARR